MRCSLEGIYAFQSGMHPRFIELMRERAENWWEYSLLTFFWCSLHSSASRQLGVTIWWILTLADIWWDQLDEPPVRRLEFLPTVYSKYWKLKLRNICRKLTLRDPDYSGKFSCYRENIGRSLKSALRFKFTAVKAFWTDFFPRIWGLGGCVSNQHTSPSKITGWQPLTFNRCKNSKNSPKML